MSTWNNKKKKYVKPEPDPSLDMEPTIAPEVSEYVESVPEERVKGICPICNGSKHTLAVGTHAYTKILKTFSVPCICYTSTTVSSQYKLLQHLGGQYMHPDKLSPHLSPDFENLWDCPNYLLVGNYDALLFVIKALIMKHRFEMHPPRILFSRSIDIVHDFHVPKDDGSSLHLSATANYDLVILVFGSNERNQAIAPCMAQLVQTRLDEQKPTWIYFPENMPVLTPTSQEYSSDLAITLEKKFKRIGVKTDLKLEALKVQTKQSYTRF
jgi:hypothetical protein